MMKSDATAGCDQATGVDLGFVELTWLQMAVLGVIQGITELLPISSTAHLRVIPGVLGWRDPGSAFSAAMQLASFLAVIVYFKKEIASLGSSAVRAVSTRNYGNSDFRLVLGILIGTIPLVLAGLLAAAAAQWLPLSHARIAGHRHCFDRHGGAAWHRGKNRAPPSQVLRDHDA